MRIRYIISDKWCPSTIIDVVSSAVPLSEYLGLDCKITIKLLNTCSGEATTERIRSNKYEIRIAADCDDAIESLAHELVHVKQFCDNRLRVLPSGWEFEGVCYKEAQSALEYLQQPWEMEARAMEEVLMEYLG